MPEEDNLETPEPGEDTPTPQDDDGQETGESESDLSLEEQLKKLLEKKETAQKEQVDANLAELEKLLDEVAKAQADYDAEHKALQKTQGDLKTEFDTLDSALKAALGTSGPSIDQIKAAIKGRTDAQSNAHKALAKAKAELAKAEADDAARADELKNANGELDVWRKPVESISARHKEIEKTLKDIKELRNKHKQAEAYWKLALGKTHGVDGQVYVDIALKAPPEVLAPDKLRTRIREKWNAVVAARTNKADAALTLGKAKEAAKVAEATAAAADKSIIKDITEDLAKL